ncbi:MAG: hypothetical protein JNL98_05275 [Bryobacterales bacterium]|nr:hypothetical protein [Bryobacterales bacterium]
MTVQRRSVWMNAWDLDGREPAEVIEALRRAGMNSCSLALSYHGGRMLLARHPGRVVYEQPDGALYFRAGLARFPEPLVPEVSDLGRVAEDFLRECRHSGFDAQAWIVLCHNDALGRRSPEYTVENAFGERYHYALCPAQPAVQDYCVELCRQAASVEGIRGLDLEALGWLGYEHAGLHDKRGVPLPAHAAWWLSICCCPACRVGTGDLRGELCERIRTWLRNPWQTQECGFEEVAEWRASVQLTLLRKIRAAAGDATLNVRTAQDRRFSGGKSNLRLEEMAGLAHEATFTFFGASETAMASGLNQLPHSPAIQRNGGFAFVAPDCNSAEDIRKRISLLRDARLDGWGFYGFGMASPTQWNWLIEALKGGTE